MLKVICCVRDQKATTYALPFTSHNHQVALRDFGHACRDQNSQLYKNPEDFDLFAIGTFDDQTGEILGHTPQLLASAVQFTQGEFSL